MKPHKHAELIKAWADGAEIEWKTDFSDGWKRWYYENTPPWCSTNYEFRIKPEPKPDRLFAVMVGGGIYEGFKTKCCKLKLTFDGETGKLKSAEVLK